MTELEDHRGGFVFEKLPGAVDVEVAQPHDRQIAALHPLVGEMVHRQFAESVDVGGVFPADGLGSRSVAVGGPAAGIDHRRPHLIGHLQQILEGVEIGLHHDLLIAHRRIADRRFVKNHIEAEIPQTLQIRRLVDIPGNDLSPKALQIFVVAEALEIAVVEGLGTAEAVEDHHLRFGSVLLEPMGEVGADEAGASGDENSFVVEVHRVPLM